MKNRIVISAVVAGLLIMTGCGSSSSSKTPTGTVDDTPSQSTVKSITIDATAGGFNASADDLKNKYTYFDFATGKVIEMNDEDVDNNQEWDIAFKRLNVKLNGGESGSGTVTGAVGDMQSELYDESGEIIPAQIMALDDASGLVEFKNTESNVTAFTKDSIGSAIAKEWWRDFDMSAMPPVLKANDDNWFVVRSSTGDSYAKIHATKVESANRALSNLQLEMYIQGQGETVFSDTVTVADINFTTGVSSIYYDFDTASTVDENAEWDLKIDKDWKIWMNSTIYGCGQGGVFGSDDGIPLMALNAMITADGKSDSGESVPKYFPDTESSIFSTYSWYAFNFNKDHKAWANYRTYLIKVAEGESYRVQLTNYYNSDPKPMSGHVTMRYERIEK